MSGKQFLYIIIATLITILIWFGVDIYRSQNTVQVAPEIQQMLESVDPIINQDLINDL